MINRVAFLNKFLLSPGKIGSITPSSKYLTQKMLSAVPWAQIETLVELGAGTGVFTRYIADHKTASCQVLVIERDFHMRKLLRNTYPMFHFGAKAENLDRLLHQHALSPADCIISGLPFATFPDLLRHKLIATSYRVLKPEGIFIAFQYSLQMRKTLKTYFPQVGINFVPLNIPPAFVYFCKKTVSLATVEPRWHRTTQPTYVVYIRIKQGGYSQHY